MPFFFVPVGPRNHFAVDLGLDRDDPLSEMEAISNGEEILIDRRRDRRRVFVNNLDLAV